MITVKPGYFLSNHCATCRSKDRAGNPLRDWVDNLKDSGEPTVKIVGMAREKGFFISQPNLDRHFNKHSPWIAQGRKELAQARLENRIAMERQQHRNAEEELQHLVDVGGDRVRRGEITVDKELFMFAIDRQTKNKQPFSIQNLVMNFGTALAEKPVIQGEISEPS